MDFHRWVQFELDRQLGGAAADARAAGMRIGLYQDLAVGTSPAGADAWAYPELFVRGASVGAPPDPYSATGQNWGLPAIDSASAPPKRYEYWVHLLRAGFRHAGALRIDHVLGLFRLFWIPDGCSGARRRVHALPGRRPARHPRARERAARRARRRRRSRNGSRRGAAGARRAGACCLQGAVVRARPQRTISGRQSSIRRSSLATANTHDMPALSGFWNGVDIDVRRQVGLIASNDDFDRAHAERGGERDALLRRLVR